MIIERRFYNEFEAAVAQRADDHNSISTGSIRMAKEPLLARRVGSSVVLAALNSETAIALIGHFNTVEEPENNAHKRGLFEVALSHLHLLGNPGNTSVWLSGGAADEQDTSCVTAQSRWHAAEIVRVERRKLAAMANITVEWLDFGEAIDIELNNTRGVLTVHNYPQQR